MIKFCLKNEIHSAVMLSELNSLFTGNGQEGDPRSITELLTAGDRGLGSRVRDFWGEDTRSIVPVPATRVFAPSTGAEVEIEAVF